LVAAFLSGCKSGKAAGGATVDASAPATESDSGIRASVAAEASPEAEPPDAGDRPVYRSFKGKTFFFASERRGSAVRAIYNAYSPPVDFRGKATDSTHSSVQELAAPPGGKPMTIMGEWSTDGSTLKATLTDPRAKKTTELVANEGRFRTRVRRTSRMTSKARSATTSFA
jgi:hypothetical protein